MKFNRAPGIRPRPSLWRRLDMAARFSFPALATGLLLLILSAPLGLPGQAELQKAGAVCCIFFWSLFRPGSMPPLAVFLLGFLSDLLFYAPPGVTVLTWLAVHGLALRWRRTLVRLGFVLVWFAFITAAIGAAGLEWLMTSLLSLQVMPPQPAVFEALLSVGLYPLFAVILTRAHQGLAEPELA